MFEPSSAMGGTAIVSWPPAQQSTAVQRSVSRLLNGDSSWAWRRGKTNFFEKRVGDYQKAGVMAGLSPTASSHTISFDEDF